MKNLLLIILALNGFGTALFAQSKKQVNEQLILDLATKKQVYDSLQEMQNELTDVLKYSKYNLSQDDQLLKNLQRESESKRLILASNYRILNESGYDANTIISNSEILKLSPPQIEKEFRVTAGTLYKPFLWTKADESRPDLATMKIKTQNEWLTSKIRVYDSVNAVNSIVLSNELLYLDTLLMMDASYKKTLEKCRAYTKTIVEKSDALAIKWNEIQQKKEEEEERENAKKNAEWERNRKKGILTFVPPVIVEDIERPVLSTESENAEVKEAIPDDFIVTSKTPLPPPAPPVILDVIEEPAEFPGGNEALKKYLNENMILPESVQKGNVSGKCYLKFVVSAKGQITDVKVQRGVPDCPECDIEAKRLVENMPEWKPGTNNGKAVNMWYNLPITFKTPN